MLKQLLYTALLLITLNVCAQQSTNFTSVTGFSDDGSGNFTSTTTGWNQNMLTSENFIAANSDGSVSITIANTTDKFALGLSTVTSSLKTKDITYRIIGGNKLHIWESNKHKGNFGNLVIGDEILISRESNQIVFKKNGNVLVSLTTDPSLTLFVKVQTQTTSITIPANAVTGDYYEEMELDFTAINETCINPGTGSIDLTVTKGLPPYTFSWSGGETIEDLSTLSSGTYTVTVTDAINKEKTITIGILSNIVWTSILDLSATSRNKILAGENGIIRHQVDQDGVKKSFGFSIFDSEDTGSEIDYAFELAADGSLNIIEHGNKLTGDFGTYAIDDIIEIERIDGSINYKNNGIILHATLSNKTLLVKYNLDVIGATFNKVTSNFCIPTIIEYTTINNSKNHLGEIIITPVSGRMPFTYFWNDGNTDQNRVDLFAGKYQLSIIDTLLDTTQIEILVGVEIEWVNAKGLVIRGNTIIKNGEEGWGTGQVSINNACIPGVTVRTEVSEIDKMWAFGFRDITKNQAISYEDLDFGFYINNNNQLFILERNSPLVTTAVGVVAEGDVLSIEQTSDLIILKRNNVVLAQSEYQKQYIVDFTFGSAKIINSGILFGPPCPTCPTCPTCPIIAPIKFPFITMTENIEHISCYSVFGGAIDITPTIEFTIGLPTEKTGNFSFNWVSPNGFTSNSEDIANIEAGEYTVTVTSLSAGPNGYYPTYTKTFYVGYATFWKNLVKTTDDGNNLAKGHYWNIDWNAGASSSNKLLKNTDGSASFELDRDYSGYQEHANIYSNTGVFAFGLSENDNGVDHTSIEYGIRILAGNYSPYVGSSNVPMKYIIVENGVPLIDGMSGIVYGDCEIGDVFKIERVDDGGGNANFIYSRNSTPIYISTNQPYDRELIIDVSIYEGTADYSSTVPADELGFYSQPQIVNAASSFECTDDPTINYKANAWVKLAPPQGFGGGTSIGGKGSQKRIGVTSDVITGSNEVKFVYELWNDDYSTLIETKEWYLLDLNNEWTFYQIEFQVNKQFKETNMLVYIKNDEVKTTTVSSSLYIDDLVIYPDGAKYSYTSNDKFGNATYVTDMNENHSQVIYDEWARQIISIDANHEITSTFDYKLSDNLLYGHSYNEVTTFVAGSYNTARNYLDGFGKVKQTIISNPSYNLKVIASTIEQDNLGRNIKTYKPFALTGSVLPEKIINSYVLQTQNTYGTSTSPFVEIDYENWPDAKVTSTHLPILGSETARTTSFDDNGLPQIQFGNRTYLQNELIISTVTNEIGDEVAIFTDKQGRKIAQYSPIGKSHTVDATGVINEATGSPFEYATTFYEYDEANHLKKITDPEGKVTRYSYNSLGQVIQEVNPDKGITAFKYDEFGRLRFVKDQDDRNQFDVVLGGPFFIDHFTYNKYDDWNRLIASGMIKTPLASPTGTVSTFGNVGYINNTEYPYSTSPGKETHIVYEYDGTIEDNSLAQLTDEFVYSNHSNLVPQETDHKTYTYDFKGQLATKTFNLSGITAGHKYTYIYNNQGLPSIIAYENPVNGAYNFTQLFSYDGMGNLITAQSNNGSNLPLEDVKYTYDPLGRLFKKGLSPTGVTTDPYQEYVAYNYNIRESQEKQIAKRFKNELTFGLRGDIINQVWNNNYFDNTTAPPPYTMHSYDYYYDDLNRLTGADYIENQSDNNPYATIETELKDEIPLITCGPLVLDEFEENLDNLKQMATDPKIRGELLLTATTRLLKEADKIKADYESQGKTINDLTDLEIEKYVRQYMQAITNEEKQLVEASILTNTIKIKTEEPPVRNIPKEEYEKQALESVKNIITKEESSLLQSQPDTTTIDSSLINTNIASIVETCNSLLKCTNRTDKEKLDDLNESSRTTTGEIELLQEELKKLKKTAAIHCIINLDAMAYQTLVNDVPVNPITITSQKYDAAYWYQTNGNFTEVNRYDQTGDITTQDYTYTANKNQLAAVNWDEPVTGISTSTYTYDALGNLGSDLRSDVTNISYNQFHNLPVSMEKGSGDIYHYRYNAGGNRSVKVLNATDTEYYLEGIIVDQNDKPKQYSITEGFATLDAGNNLQKSYNITDWLGNVRLVMDETGNIENVRDHFPYGKLMDGRNYSSGNSEGARYQFTGHEFDGETMFGYHGARYYNRELGRYMSMDPLQTDFTAYTPYNYTLGNPIMLIDPNGLAPSTHTDEEGNVLAVYDDDDNNVYKHDIKKKDYKGEKLEGENDIAVGKTEFWDEFARHNTKGEILSGLGQENYANPNAHINFGKNINDLMGTLHNRAKLGMDNSDDAAVIWLKHNSGNNQPLDIKTRLGENEGFLFQGNYISGESAGNYLFGKNLKYSGNYTLSKGEYWSLSAQQFGAYHNKQNKVNNPKVAPYYGEIPYSGRQIFKGYWGSPNPRTSQDFGQKK